MKIKLNPTRRRKGSATLWILGLVVLVVGVIAVVKLWRFCEKYLPPPPKGPPPQKTNDDNATPPGFFASLNSWWEDPDQGPPSPFVVIAPQSYCVLDYGVTNTNGTNYAWLQVIAYGQQQRDYAETYNLTTVAAQQMAAAGYPTITNIGLVYGYASGEWLFVDANADPSCTNRVVIYRADNPQMSNAVPVFTNTVPDTGLFQWTDEWAFDTQGFYGAIRTP